MLLIIYEEKQGIFVVQYLDLLQYHFFISFRKLIKKEQKIIFNNHFGWQLLPSCGTSCKWKWTWVNTLSTSQTTHQSSCICWVWLKALQPPENFARNPPRFSCIEVFPLKISDGYNTLNKTQLLPELCQVWF